MSPLAVALLTLGLTTPARGQACSDAWVDADTQAVPSTIVVSLSRRNDYTLTSAEHGVLFDIDADGTPERVAWTPAGSEIAFLAIDRNGDRTIGDGSELFGNHTLPGITNGFEALRALNMASNGGVAKASVSEEDPLFARLLLWTDRNHNGISERDELQAARDVLSDVGIGYRVFNRVDDFGNLFRYRGWVHIRTSPGRNEARSARENDERTRYVWDVYLKIGQ